MSVFDSALANGWIDFLIRSEGAGAVAADAPRVVGRTDGDEGKSGFRFCGKTQPSLLVAAPLRLLLFRPTLFMVES